MVAPNPPVLEMLWESHDPRHELGRRFGFADAESAARWVTAALADRWGVDATCERVVISASNALAWVGTASGPMLAKWSIVPGRHQRLAAQARLTGWLHGQGLPVSAPVPALDGGLQLEVDGGVAPGLFADRTDVPDAGTRVSMGLQRKIEGQLLDVTDPEQVWAAGATVARLQDALAAYPDAGSFAALDGVRQSTPLSSRIAGWLEGGARSLPPAMGAAADSLRGLLADPPSDELPAQLLHDDIRSANIIWSGGEVAAVIDFDEVTHDHPVVELAKGAVLLGTRFHDWGPISVSTRARFLDGYRSVRRLTPAEEGWLAPLVLWLTLQFVPADGEDSAGWDRSALDQLAALR